MPLLAERVKAFKKKKPVSGKVHDYFLTYQKLYKELMKKGLKEEAEELRNHAFKKTVEEKPLSAGDYDELGRPLSKKDLELKREMEETELTALRISEEEKELKKGKEVMELLADAEAFCRNPADRTRGEFILRKIQEQTEVMKGKLEQARSAEEKEKLNSAILSLGKVMYDVRSKLAKR